MLGNQRKLPRGCLTEPESDGSDGTGLSADTEEGLGDSAEPFLSTNGTGISFVSGSGGENIKVSLASSKFIANQRNRRWGYEEYSQPERGFRRGVSMSAWSVLEGFLEVVRVVCKDWPYLPWLCRLAIFGFSCCTLSRSDFLFPFHHHLVVSQVSLSIVVI